MYFILFIVYIVKIVCSENGFIESAVYLCELCRLKDTKRSIFYFKLMNLYIREGKYDDAVHTCRRYLYASLPTKSKDNNSSSSSGGISKSSSDDKKLISLITDILSVIGHSSLPIDNLLSVQYESKPSKIDEKKEIKINELWSSLKPCQLLWNAADEPYATILTSDGKFFDTSCSNSSGKPFSENEMEMLSILFVLVKALYLVGSLRLIPPLIKMIEPLRYKRKIVDNDYLVECNYYKYISQLLCETGSDLPRYMMSSTPSPSPEYPEITIIGDSDVLSSGWRIIKIHGRDVLLRLKYVENLKNENSNNSNNIFENYKRLYENIKPKSIVIFGFSEFDKMKNLLEDNNNDINSDIVERIVERVKKYVNEIKRMKNEKNIFVIVQPILPINNNNGCLTKLYNEILRVECEKENISNYISLSEIILNNNSTLRSQYELDKTHIHPIYLYDVVKALENIIPVSLLQIPPV